MSELRGFLHTDDIAEVLRANRDPSGRTFDYLSEKVVREHLSAISRPQPLAVGASLNPPAPPYQFSFSESKAAGGRSILQFSEDHGSTWKEVRVTGADPRALQNRTHDKGPFMSELRSFLHTNNIAELINSNRDPSGRAFDYLSQGIVERFLTSQIGQLPLQSSALSLHPATSACSLMPSTSGPPTSAPPTLNFALSSRRMVEFYHEDPLQCDGEAHPVNHWLGNFFLTPVSVPWGNFKTSEAAFQARKCLLLYADLAAQRECLQKFERADHGEKAFTLSQQLPRLDPSSPSGQFWISSGRDQTMREVLRAKFSNRELCTALQSTYPHFLHETIPQSRSRDPGAMHWGAPPNDPANAGKNMLGRLLMEIRDETRSRGRCL